MRVQVYAEHEVAEGAVDVLAAALHGRVVGCVDDVDRHGAGDDVVGGVEGVVVEVPGADHVVLGAAGNHDGRAARRRRRRRGRGGARARMRRRRSRWSCRSCRSFRTVVARNTLNNGSVGF